MQRPKLEAPNSHLERARECEAWCTDCLMYQILAGRRAGQGWGSFGQRIIPLAGWDKKKGNINRCFPY
jgi:hypothetical protein